MGYTPDARWPSRIGPHFASSAKLAYSKKNRIWFSAIEKFMAEKLAGKLFELSEIGEVVAWKVH